MEKNINRSYRDGMFRTLFNDKEKMLELFNALEGTSYGEEMLDKIKVLTLDNVLYMGIHNDLAFELGDKVMVLAEHQSTLCGNIPIRMAEYFGEILQKMYSKRIYGTKKLQVPVPEFFVFYNGDKDTPEEQVLRLSDHYAVNDSEGHEPKKLPANSAEIVVKLINICYDEGKKLLNKCRTLKEYSIFIGVVNAHLKDGLSLEEAVRLAIVEAEDENILSEFLQNHGSEVMSMIHGEVTMEEYGEIMRDEGFEDGVKQGRIEGKNDGIKQGRTEGKNDGIKQGRTEGIQSLVRAMYERGTSEAEISHLTGIDIGEIEKMLK